MIHRYQLGGYNIVLDVCSGAVHAVDALAYDMIGLYETLPREELLAAMAKKYPDVPAEELEECFEQIGALKEAGQLFTPDSFEPLAGKFKEKSGATICGELKGVGTGKVLCECDDCVRNAVLSLGEVLGN